MKQWKFIIIVSIYLLTPVWSISFASKASVKSVVTQSVFIGKNKFFLYGYTTPTSLITLTGQGISAQSQFKEAGYFEFSGVFSPLVKREVCLISFDNVGRRSFPSWLPPFPLDYEVKIGPVIMAPTISTNNNNVTNRLFNTLVHFLRFLELSTWVKIIANVLCTAFSLL